MKTTSSKLHLLILCCAAAVLFGLPATARAVLYTGKGNNSNWSNPANWEGETVPRSGSAEIPSGKTVYLDIDVSLSSLTVSGPGSGVYAAGFRTLGISGTLQISDGTLSVGNSDFDRLTVNIGSAASMNLGGGTRLIGGMTLNNAGRIEWRGGPVFLEGTINNAAAGLFVIFGDYGIGTATRSGLFNNAGRIIKETGTGVSQFSGFTAETNQINTTLNNTGTVAVASGTIQIGSGKSTGNFEIGSGNTLLVGGNGTHVFEEPVTFTGAGTCAINGDRVDLIGNINSNVDFEVRDRSNVESSVDPTRPQATLTGNGRLLWKGGRIAGTFTVGEGVRSILSGGAVKVFDGAFTNKGTMDWTGPGPLATGSSTFRNEGTFNVLAPGLFLADTEIHGQTFENIGTLNTFGGGTSVTDDTTIVNSGVLNIGGFEQAGILQVNRGIVQTATGTLYMEIGGTDAATPQFDQLRGAGSSIDGTLTVSAIHDFVPAKDARFTLIASQSGKFARVFTPGGSDRFKVEYPGDSSTDLVSLSDAAIPLRLWGAGRDLARNESPDRDAELQATNETVPQWSYGYRATATGTGLTLFTPAQHINDGTGLQGWIANGQATLAVNTKNTPIVFNTGSGNYKPLLGSQIYMSPGTGNEFLVARWTAPAAGDYRVAARWLDLDNHGGNGATAHFVVNGKQEFTETFEAKPGSRGRARLRAQTLSLNAGDTVDFVLGSNGENLYDATAFNAVVRRVPKITNVTVTPSAADNTYVEGQEIAIDVEVDHIAPIKSVALDDVLDVIGTSATPPYHFVQRLEAGTHYIRATATDDRQAPGVSSATKITVVKPTVSVRKGATTAGAAAATAGGKTYYAVKSGQWQDRTTWSPQGVPADDDQVVVGSGLTVFMNRFETVQAIELVGTLAQFEGTAQQVGIFVRNHAAITGGEMKGLQGQPPFIFQAARSCKVFISSLPATFTDVQIDSLGRLNLVGGGVVSTRTTFKNTGTLIVAPAPATQIPVQLKVDNFEHAGGLSSFAPNTVLKAPQAIKIAGAVQLSPNQLIGNDGSTLIGNDGSTLIGNDGSTLVGLDGGTLIGLDGGTLIGNDGGTLIGPDGAALIGNDGSTLIGNDGSTLIGNDGSTLIAPNGIRSSASEAAFAATGDAAITLAGGTITGTGELRGNVVNQGAFIAPGNSAGGIVVNGNYTQEAAGTLVLEVGGKTVGPFTYDIFQVSGAANLAGNLVVKTINSYTPAAADAVTSLIYGSHTGSFDKITSNAQVTFGATGGQVKVTGSNPPAPKALNIATRMRVEQGDNALIGGFFITGSAPKKVLIRALAPSLGTLGVAGTLNDPTLELDRNNASARKFNDDWQQGDTAAIPSGFAPSDPRECVIVATLAAGPHTAIVSGKGSDTGVAIVEVYDLEGAAPEALANISTRGQVQGGDNVMIGGFIIGGDYPAKVLLRAIGPSLPIAGVLQDPTLELVDSNGARISNDNWRATQEAEIIATTVPPTNDKEAAIVATLTPGNYTAIVRGKDDTTGVAVVEGYNLQ